MTDDMNAMNHASYHLNISPGLVYAKPNPKSTYNRYRQRRKGERVAQHIGQSEASHDGGTP